MNFGDYVSIEQNRYGAENEHYTHKVVTKLESNAWVDVPVTGSTEETLHDKMEWVVSCICCGPCETKVLKYRIKDVTLLPSPPSEPAEVCGDDPCIYCRSWVKGACTNDGCWSALADRGERPFFTGLPLRVKGEGQLWINKCILNQYCRFSRKPLFTRKVKLYLFRKSISTSC